MPYDSKPAQKKQLQTHISSSSWKGLRDRELVKKKMEQKKLYGVCSVHATKILAIALNVD